MDEIIIPINTKLITVDEDSTEFKIMLNEISELKNIIKNLNNVIYNQTELINNNIKNLNDINNKINKLDLNHNKSNLLYEYVVPVCKVLGLSILKSSTLTFPYIIYKILK